MRKRELDDIVIKELQKEVALYFEQNFPERYKVQRKHLPVYKAIEALGELMGSLWIERTDRSYDPEVQDELKKQSLGKAVIYLIDFCARHGWDFQHVIRQIWELTHGEDWNPYPDVGRPPKEEKPLKE